MATDNDSMLVAVGAAIALNEARPHMVKLAMIHKLVVGGEAKFEGEFAFLARICKAAADFVATVLAEKDRMTDIAAELDKARKAAQS